MRGRRQLFCAAIGVRALSRTATGEVAARLEETLDQLDRAVEELQGAALDDRRHHPEVDGKY